MKFKEWLKLEVVTASLLTQTILDVVAERGMCGARINAGGCEEFAEEVVERLGGHTDELTTDTFLGHPGGTHSYIKFRGRYYDAEAPEGVSQIGQLPVIQRFWLKK